MSNTIEDLKTAFAGESQANRRYLAFARQAEEEGYPQVAKLFRAAAAAETVHALTHLRAMGGVASTADNLRAAIGGENYEVDTMYPPFIKDAEEEGNKKAYNAFKWAWEVEKVHASLYAQALELMETSGREADGPDYYVCPICGYTHERGAPDKCPVCGTPGKRFECVS
jgi:rubrerythrin